jgi:hypothetical protein
MHWGAYGGRAGRAGGKTLFGLLTVLFLIPRSFFSCWFDFFFFHFFSFFLLVVDGVLELGVCLVGF